MNKGSEPLPSPIRQGRQQHPAVAHRRLPEAVCEELRFFCSDLKAGYVNRVYLSAAERRQLAMTVSFNSINPNLLNTLDLTDEEYRVLPQEYKSFINNISSTNSSTYIFPSCPESPVIDVDYSHGEESLTPSHLSIVKNPAPITTPHIKQSVSPTKKPQPPKASMR